MYSLRFPFTLVHEVRGFEEPVEFQVDQIHVQVSRNGESFLVKANGFQTDHEAVAFVDTLWGALAVFCVERNSGFFAETALQDMTYTDDPVGAGLRFGRTVDGLPSDPIHGFGDGNGPVAYRSDGNYRFIQACQPSFVSWWPQDKFIDLLARGLRLPHVGSALQQEKLRTSLEIFFSSHMLPLKSKFIAQVMALEVLSDTAERHPRAIELLKRWEGEIQTERAAIAVDMTEGQETNHALESLAQSAFFQREESKRTKVRRLVLRGLPNMEKDARTQLAKDVVNAYDNRGTLVHDGMLDQATLTESWAVVQRTLTDLFKARLGVPSDFRT